MPAPVAANSFAAKELTGGHQEHSLDQTLEFEAEKSPSAVEKLRHFLA
jgi:hypothetical protein